jgi:hypothetical protein
MPARIAIDKCGHATSVGREASLFRPGAERFDRDTDEAPRLQGVRQQELQTFRYEEG